MSAEQIELTFPDPARFDGDTFEAEHDGSRLARQLRRVAEVMSGGYWRTLDEIAALTDDPPASVSARLRDLRKERFGGYTVERRRRGDAARGLFEYRLDPESGHNAQHSEENAA